MTWVHDSDRAGLGPDEFLDHLRDACRRMLKSEAVSNMRCSCDMWTIDPRRVDPLEPLMNRGRRTLSWPRDVWSSISTDLLGAAGRAAEDPGECLPASLVEYAAYVHLELSAREEPPQGTRDESFVLPLVVAAREKTGSTEFRRYVLGWLVRAGAHPWNEPEMVFAAALVVALGSAEDPATRGSVRKCRETLVERAASGEGRFRDRVRSDHRRLWREAASASAPDAADWAGRFMA